MHLFQEVFSCKLIFVDKILTFFSNTGRKNSISMPGTDSGPHLQACREGPRVSSHFRSSFFVRGVVLIRQILISVFLINKVPK